MAAMMRRKSAAGQIKKVATCNQACSYRASAITPNGVLVMEFLVLLFLAAIWIACGAVAAALMPARRGLGWALGLMFGIVGVVVAAFVGAMERR